VNVINSEVAGTRKKETMKKINIISTWEFSLLIIIDFKIFQVIKFQWLWGTPFERSNRKPTERQQRWSL